MRPQDHDPAFSFPGEQHQLMVALWEVAARTYHEATGKDPVRVAELNKLARVIAKHVRLFTRASEDDDFHLVMPGEVEEAQFQLGGAYLEFPDNRPSLGNLTLLRRELPKLEGVRDLLHAIAQSRANP